MSNHDIPLPSFDNIIDEANIDTSDFEDPLILEMMEQACSIDQLLRERKTTPEVRQKIIDKLNQTRKSLINQDLEMFGPIYQDVSGNWALIDNPNGSRATWRGFCEQENNHHEHQLYHKLSSTQAGHTYHFVAPVQNYIIFPNIISEKRIARLSEPFLEEIDNRIYADGIQTMGELLVGLKEYATAPDGLSFTWQSSNERYREHVQHYVENYLNECTGMNDALALTIRIENLPDDTRPIALHTPRFVLKPAGSDVYLCISGTTTRYDFVDVNTLIPINEIKHGELVDLFHTTQNGPS